MMSNNARLLVLEHRKIDKEKLVDILRSHELLNNANKWQIQRIKDMPFHDSPVTGRDIFTIAEFAKSISHSELSLGEICQLITKTIYSKFILFDTQTRKETVL